MNRTAIFAEDKTLGGDTLATQYDGQIVTVLGEAYDGFEFVMGFKLPEESPLQMLGYDVTFADGTEGWVFADELIFDAGQSTDPEA